MPPALPPWPAPDAPAAAPGPTNRPPAAPPGRAGPPPRRAPAPPPSTPRPCDWSTARRPPAAPPAGAAARRAAPASGSSVSPRCPVAGRRARPDPGRCTAPAASRPTAPRTRSSRPPRPPRDPSPAARSPGHAGPSGRPPRRGTAPPAPPRSSAPPPPPRVRLPQANAQPTGRVTPQEPSPNTSAGNRMISARVRTTMKIALDPYMHRHVSLLELPRFVAGLGYEHIELSPRADFLDWWVHPRAYPERIREFKKALSGTWRQARLAAADVSLGEPGRGPAQGGGRATGGGRSRSRSRWAATRMNSEFGRGPHPERGTCSSCCAGGMRPRPARPPGGARWRSWCRSSRRRASTFISSRTRRTWSKRCTPRST